MSYAIVIQLIGGILIWLVGGAETAMACNQSPTAVISKPFNGESYINGEPIEFDGTSSVANCGSINQYRWRVYDHNTSNWDTVSYSGLTSYTFTNNGNYSIELRVRNTSDKYDSQTVQIEIKTFEVANVITYHDYDLSGNLLQVSDANGHVTNLTWDANEVNLTEIKRVNPGGTNLVIKAGYNSKGMVDTLWNENNRITTFEYDELNKLERIRNHTGNILEEYVYTLTGSAFSTSNMNRILAKRYATSSVIRETTQFYDGLGRPVQVQSKSGSNSLVAGSVSYDERGREWQRWKAYPKIGAVSYDASYAANSNSYYSSSGAGPDAGGRGYVETTYEASPLGRPLRVNPEGVSGSAGGTLRYDYGVSSVGGHNAFWTEITDEADKKTRTWVDGWGRTIRTTAGYGTSDAAETNFEYDKLDRLTKVISPEGLETIYQYNKRGLLSQKTSPDAGTVNYVYDNNGSLRYMRDANLAAANRYMAYSYDFAGRVIKEETCSGGIPSSLTASCSSSQQAITYTYDNANVAPYGVSFTVNNPLGNLTKVAFQGGYYLYSYDNDGNIERMYNKLDGLSGRNITYQYNRLGELTYRHMSGNTHRWWYTYDDLGQLKLVRTNTSTTQVTDADYSAYWPGGMMQTEVLGNQTISFGYDARDRLTSINDVTNSSHPFSAAYTYLANSNIDTVQYHQPSSPHSDKRYLFKHTYDTRNQLTEADYNYLSGSTWTNSSEFDLSNVSYNKDGNIADKNHNNALQSGSHTYNYISDTNKISSISRSGSGSLSFGYDGNGNVTSLSGLGYSISSVSYDWRNLPLSMNAGGSRTYRYDHTGARVYKSYEGVHYLRGAYGEILAIYEGGSLAYWNILRPEGTVIGRRESGGTRRYYHRDHLGSTRAVVTSGGTVTETYDFMPFGMEMDRSKTGSGPTRNKFTGHETDEENQLIHMEWRGYLAEFGRFMSVDPLADEYSSWSPYNYALNNPLIFIDPTGLCPEEVDGVSGNCADRSLGFLGGFFSQLNTSIFDLQMPAWVGGLFVAQETGEAISAEVKGAATDAAKTGVDAGIVVADAVSDGSTYVAGAGVVAAPFTKGGSLAVSGTALSVGTIADGVSLGLKTIDYVAFDGSGDAVVAQFAATAVRGVGGRAVQGASSRMVTRTSSAVTGTAFRSTPTGRFVSNRYGHTVTAASDATQVVINVTVPNQPIRR